MDGDLEDIDFNTVSTLLQVYDVSRDAGTLTPERKAELSGNLLRAYVGIEKPAVRDLLEESFIPRQCVRLVRSFASQNAASGTDLPTTLVALNGWLKKKATVKMALEHGLFVRDKTNQSPKPTLLHKAVSLYLGQFFDSVSPAP
ncbi:MAG: hypothetical protein AB7E52_08390 [Bdellovibrionales bacterium]